MKKLIYILIPLMLVSLFLLGCQEESITPGLDLSKGEDTGAVKIVLIERNVITQDNLSADGGIHENSNGFVIYNPTPDGDTATVIQIQLWDAAPNYTYYVYSGGEELGSIVTNNKGKGQAHFNLPDAAPGAWVNIWNEDHLARLLGAEL